MKYAHKSGLQTWYSRKHSDGSSYPGWIIVGIGKKKSEQITYHINNDYLYELERYEKFAEELDNAPEWDGHTPTDVFSRLRQLVLFGEIK